MLSHALPAKHVSYVCFRSPIDQALESTY